MTATELAGEPIIDTLTTAPGNGAKIGGLKVITESAWFAARPSGTEDVYKIYAESFRARSTWPRSRPRRARLCRPHLASSRIWRVAVDSPAAVGPSSVAQAIPNGNSSPCRRARDRDGQPASRVHLAEEHPRQRLDLVCRVAIGVEHGRCFGK